MSDTIQTPADTTTDEATSAAETEEFLHLDPADIIIGINVRTDLRPDHKEFRKSIKERGVIEAVTVYRNEDGQYVLLRGQRRTVTAAEVGTPTGTIPARVVPSPPTPTGSVTSWWRTSTGPGCARPRSSRAWSSWPCSA